MKEVNGGAKILLVEQLSGYNNVLQKCISDDKKLPKWVKENTEIIKTNSITESLKIIKDQAFDIIWLENLKMESFLIETVELYSCALPDTLIVCILKSLTENHNLDHLQSSDVLISDVEHFNYLFLLNSYQMAMSARKFKEHRLMMASNLSDVFDQINIGFVLLNADNIVEFFNPYAKRILKNHIELTKGARFPYSFSTEGTEEIKIPENGKSKILELEYKKMGKHNNNNNLLIIRDVSELRTFIGRIQKANLQKTEYIANLSHEIRTPINAIIGFADLLDTELGDENQQLFVNYIKSSSNQLINLIEDIIDLAKIEEGKIHIQKSHFSLNKILLEIYETHNILIEAKGLEKVELRLSLPVTDDQFNIFTDPYRLRQILSNFIVNAIKFTESGYIEFGYVFPHENEIRFYVEDTGSGMPNNMLDRIFEQYEQEYNAENKWMTGAGLGLTISKKLIELLSGKMHIESKEGKGTKIFFDLPGINRQISGDEKIEDEKPDFTGKVILIVEDDNYSSAFFKTILVPTNAQIIKAYNGRQAINICLSNEKIDLVLMDIKMPVLDGLEATREIKSIRKDLPIIAQTAYAQEGNQEKCFESGCDDYLAKPINSKVLLKTVGKYLIKKDTEN